MENIIVPLIIFAIPIVAIITRHIEKVKKMELEKIDKNKIDQSLLDRIESLEETVFNLTHESSSLSDKVNFNEKLLLSLGSNNSDSGKIFEQSKRKILEPVQKEKEMELQ